MSGIAPQAGSFGTIVTLSGQNFGATLDDNTVVLKARAQGTAEIKPIAVSRTQVRFILPAAFAETAQISVRVDGRDSMSLAFEIQALVDPTPSEPASEVDAFHADLDAALGAVMQGLDQTLVPALEAGGEQAQAAQLRTAFARLRAGFDQLFNDTKRKVTPAQLAAMDALLASPQFNEALQKLKEVSRKLAATSAPQNSGVHAHAVVESGDERGLFDDLRATMKPLLAAVGLSSRPPDITLGGDVFSSEVLEDLRDTRTILADVRDIMEKLNTALGIAEAVAIGASALDPAALPLVVLLHEVRTTMETVVKVLGFAIAAIDSAPTRAVGGTLSVSRAGNDLFLNQSFGSQANPTSAELNPGHILVLESFGVTGTVDFHNDEGEAMDAYLRQLASEAGDPLVAAALAGAEFVVGSIEAQDIAVKLKLDSDRHDLFEGHWSSSQLWISALAPGEGNVMVQADLEQIVPAGETCPTAIGSGDPCIHPADLQVSRFMRAYAGTQTSGPYTQGARLISAQVSGLAPSRAYIGDSLHITGEGFTRNSQLAHQDVHFGTALDGFPEQSTGLAWSVHEDNEDYFSFDVEVPDALSGPLNVSLNTHPSNELDFTILPPHLDAPHPSAIVWEAWGVTGRGFSHTLTRNDGNWNGGRRTPYDPRGEAAHRALEFIVPESAQSGPFNVVTLGQLQSNSYPVVARRFASPVALSARDRAGLRPVVARDASNGDRIVAWIDHSNRGGNQLVASVLTANSPALGTPVVVAANIGGLPGAPSRPAVAAADGVFYIAWVADVGNYEIAFASSLDGLSWSEPRYLSSSPGSSLQPALAADGSVVAVAWVEEGTELENASLGYRISRNGGETFRSLSWSASNVADPAIAVRGQAVAVAWIAGQDVLVWRSNDAGVTTDPLWHAVRNSDGAASHPSVAIGRSCIAPDVNSVYLAWENVWNLEEEVYFARWDATTFTAPLNVSNTPVHSRSPAITVDGDCTPAMSWIEQGRPFQSAVADGSSQPMPSSLRFARSFDDGASFKTPYMSLLDSNDGSRLGHLAMIGDDRALLTLVYQDDVGGTPTVVMRTTEGEPAAPSAQPVASGETSVDLVYRGFFGGSAGGGIYVSRADGTRMQRVFRRMSTSQTVALSPDGRHIAFLPGPDRLIAAEADGAYPMYIAVTADSVMQGGAHWSPRGDYIGIACSWSACSRSTPTLGWVKPDASDFNLAGAGSPANISGFTGMQPWSPQGTLIYSNGAFGRVDPASRNGHPIAVALPQGKRGYFPAWSPDGSRIAFIASDVPNIDPANGVHAYGNLYVMNADGSNAVELTTGNDAATPVWSPDGTRLAYVTNRVGGEMRRVFMIGVSGELQSHIALASTPLLFDDSMPAFLPDGSGVLIHRRNTADHSTQLILVNPQTPTLHSAYSPSGFAGHAAAIHLGSRPTWASNASVSTQTIGTTNVTLQWSGASDDVGVTHYRLYNGNTLLVSQIPASSPSFTLSNLTSSTSYTLTVRACDAAGNCSLSGPSATFTTSGAGPVPTWSVVPPTFRTPMVYDSYTVSLEWTQANEPNVEYRLYRDGVLWRPAGQGWSLGFVTGLRPQTDYLFRVEACFASGGSCTTDGPTLTYRTPADTSTPFLQNANVFLDVVTLHYDDPLDDASVPAATDFAVTVNGASVAVSGVVVHSADEELLLTLAEPTYAGDAVLLNYTPGAAPIRDFGGNDARELFDRVVNNTASVAADGIATDADNDVYVVGSFEGAVKFGTHVLTSAGSHDAYLAKRNAAGVWQWARRLGSAGSDVATTVAVDAGNVYVAGSFEGEVTFGAQALTANGGPDLFVAKLDQDGNWVWAARGGGAPPVDPNSGLAPVDVATSVTVDSTGNVYLAGRFGGVATFDNSGFSLTSRGAMDIVVAKLNAAGTWQWATRAGTANDDSANDIAVDTTGVYVTGATSPNADFGSHTLFNTSGPFVAKLDANGIWQWVDDGDMVSGAGYAVATDGSGSIYVAGNNGLPNAYPFVGRWNAAGTRQWSQLIPGNGRGVALGLTFNGDGNLYISGQFWGSLVVNSSAIGSNGAFVAKIDTGGTWQWAMSGVAWDTRSIASCGIGTVCAVGNYSRDAIFGELPPLTTGSGNDIYIIRARNAPPNGEWLSLSGTRDAE